MIRGERIIIKKTWIQTKDAAKNNHMHLLFDAKQTQKYQGIASLKQGGQNHLDTLHTAAPLEQKDHIHKPTPLAPGFETWKGVQPGIGKEMIAEGNGCIQVAVRHQLDQEESNKKPAISQQQIGNRLGLSVKPGR